MNLFQDLEDPRIERSKRHQPLDSITIAIRTVICGSDSWDYVEMYGKSKEEWFHTFLDLPRGIPSHTPFDRLRTTCFPVRTLTSSSGVSWSEPRLWLICCPERWWLLTGQRCAAPATRGRALRQAQDRPSIGSAPGPLLSLPRGNTLTLGQVRTKEKSNEITAIPRLLEMPELNGCIVTIDAMGHGTTVQARYYISSLDVSAQRLLEVVRPHWSIGNSLHWSLDATFREDQSRVRKDHGSQNMTTLRRFPTTC